MLSILKSRCFRQGFRTGKFPDAPPNLPERFQGRPVIAAGKCTGNCTICRDTCPADAIIQEEKGIMLDLGKCLFCGKCAET